jgi:hypothetical protein
MSNRFWSTTIGGTDWGLDSPILDICVAGSAGATNSKLARHESKSATRGQLRPRSNSDIPRGDAYIRSVPQHMLNSKIAVLVATTHNTVTVGRR